MEITKERTCKDCFEQKPLGKFHGGRLYCDPCKVKREKASPRYDYLGYMRRKNKEWRQKNHSKWTFINRARQAQRRALGKIDINAYLQKVKKLGSKCVLCGVSEIKTKLTIDHIIPVSKSGTNDIRNLQPLCFPCNRIKFNSQ